VEYGNAESRSVGIYLVYNG
jgi:hypothetical protein